jgi:hypothetical protein
MSCRSSLPLRSYRVTAQPDSGTSRLARGCLRSSTAITAMSDSEVCSRSVRFVSRCLTCVSVSHVCSPAPTCTDRLLEIEGDETIEAKHTLFRLFNYVKSLLPSPDVNVMIAASKTLGRIAEMGGTAFADQIDVEVPRALEALQSDKPAEGRHAAVLVLRELARHSAAHFHPHVGLVLERIWLPLRDSRVSAPSHRSECVI